MLAIFDLDDTLVFIEGYMCPEVRAVLTYLREKNHTVAVASHNLDAKSVVQRLELTHYFALVVGEYPPDKHSKIPLVETILDHCGLEKSDIVFFDDLMENIYEMRRYGVRTKLVHYETGVTMNNVLEMGL